MFKGISRIELTLKIVDWVMIKALAHLEKGKNEALAHLEDKKIDMLAKDVAHTSLICKIEDEISDFEAKLIKAMNLQDAIKKLKTIIG